MGRRDDLDRKSESKRIDRDKERHRERHKSQNHHRDSEHRERSIDDRERDRLRKRQKRECERDSDRKDRDRDSSKKEMKKEDREAERGKRKEKEKSWELDRDDHDGKRHKREEDCREKERDKVNSDNKDGKSGEEDLEDQQRKLDEEMDKRRKRVQEWQEMKRNKEESEKWMEGGAKSDEPISGKEWNFEKESDDEDDGRDAELAAKSDEEVDPLDAFMNSVVLPEVQKLNNQDSSAVDKKFETEKDLKVGQVHGNKLRKGMNKSLGRIIPGEDSDTDYGDLEDEEVPLEEEDDDEFIKRVKKTKVEKLALVDHSKIQYQPFRRNFYIETKEISRMTSEEVATYRKQLELKIHGKGVQKPIKTWIQTGLTSKVLDIIKKLGYEKPMPVQAQALPIIMSGQDCIGVANTGSGKTLAFVLPMLRHIKDQPPLVAGDGPIGLVMAPTRELVLQIHSVIKRFAKVMGIKCVAVYGGSGVAQQISDLKLGSEIVVCTPARMIDILSKGSGKITNLRRVTYLVMDEADRMFDMGFECQITPIVSNIRPDRQTVLFSATFPRQVEIHARKVLTNPMQIQAGGRSVVNKDIAQLVEVRPEGERFRRLLELLGEWYEKGKILIFVHSQDKCDSLLRDLFKSSYPCLSLHGAKDQTDRESTISDFKNNVCSVLIATSIAARGLDVKELELVINFDAPNHYEDYVHRVGRTGRAGRKGCAITFISEEDARYAPDLVKALILSDQTVPADLKAIADGFMAKVNQGLEQAHGTGFGGKGFKFNEDEDEVRKAAKKSQAIEYGFEEDKSDSGSEDEAVREAGGNHSNQAALAQNSGITAASDLGISMSGPVSETRFFKQGALKVAELLAKIKADSMPEHYEEEFEINGFPQNVRWKLTHRETRGPISELTGTSITPKGQFYEPGKIPGPGERKLYLVIEGPTKFSVKKAKAEVKRVLEEIMKSSSFAVASQSGKYSVL